MTMVDLKLQNNITGTGKNSNYPFKVQGPIRLCFLPCRFRQLLLAFANVFASNSLFQVMFNPITVNSIKKVLAKICRLERLKVNDEHIDVIAKASGGDIRNAITSLQYFSLKPNPVHSLSVLNSATTYPERKRAETGHLDDGVLLSFGKDATLSLFHALGKFLHNKRETETLVPSGTIRAIGL